MADVDDDQNEERRHQTASEELIDALRSGDASWVVESLHKLKRVDGEALEVIAQLLAGDSKLRALFPKRLKLAGWEPGRPPSTILETERANLRSVIKRRVRKGQKLESVIAQMKEETGYSRSSLMAIWGNQKSKHS